MLTALDPAAIRSEVERICASRGFENADRLKTLLRYTVEKRLAGSAHLLKEYTLGVDVFGRGDEFNPKSDSLVRVTAGKLRLRLKEFYVENPSSQIRIEYPSGSYVPEFIELTAEPDLPTNPRSLPRRGSMPWVAVAAALLVVAGTASWIVSSHKPTRKTLTKITADAAIAQHAAISRDGKLVAYVSNRESKNFQLFLQLAGGGPPLRVAGISGNVGFPDFSPDGSAMVFVQAPVTDSAGNATRQPGIYVMPTLGGSPVRIADGDADPHFSPDGQTVVYSKSPNGIYLVPSRGGSAKRISPDHFQSAQSPIFTPDGKHILFFGRPFGTGDQGRDWWLFSVAGGALVQAGVKALVRDAEKLPDSPFYCYPSGWLENKILFWCDFGERSSLFTAGIQRSNWTITGPVERITFGAGAQEGRPSASSSGRVVFTSTARSTDLHAIAIGSNLGNVSEREQRQLTSHGADGIHHVIVSRDFVRMTYSVRGLRREIWTRHLPGGTPSLLASGRVFRSAISPDGTHVAYHQPRDDGSRIVVVPAEGGTPSVVCEDCQLVQGWTPDGRRILWGYDNYRGLLAVDVRTGVQETWVGVNRSVQAGGFSPDGKWLSLATLGFHGAPPAGYAVPIRNGRPAPESDWVFVKKGQEQMQWSPDGSVLYFLSAEDGRLCLYGQRVDPLSKQPLGNRFAVYHLHSPERSLFGSWMIPFNFAVTRREIYLTIVRQQSNVWMLQ